MKKNTTLSESLEDYLEIILELENAQKVARAKDIASKMGVQRGSVTGALKALVEKKLINYAPYSFITLTPAGKKIAREINRRHTILKDFLVRVLQVEELRAEETACRMEHAVDKESIDKLVRFIEFIDQCPRTGGDWVSAFEQFCASENRNEQDCRACLAACGERYLSEIDSASVPVQSKAVGYDRNTAQGHGQGCKNRVQATQKIGRGLKRIEDTGRNRD